ncbi:S41 family peptidase [Alteromonas sp. C1M14]|uniref:S41 family peptidase n=1 Tax=Alteromonas sp. C1M14 TaxID=2841567 RepID=UPI001C0A2FBE|nr:S41 family peptidase [Alteromonas sp. C1M14]MBU2979729.1 PDZ domain-containing protein [Alteromonas sp. C1M14]
MKRVFAFALGLFTSQAFAQPLIFQPEISPDGSTIAFSYQGDIWTMDSHGGNAKRLTIHEGYDGNPVWSDDSSMLAFNSDRFGNNDVFTIARDGGIPTRLTFHSGQDKVMQFTRNNTVLFNTRRVYAQVEREWEIYSVPASGDTTEQRFMDALGYDAQVSPDGNKVLFVRGSNRIDREAYRGPANRDVWLYDIQSESYTRITQFDGNDFMPKWIDNSHFYFISSRSGKYNVYKKTLGGGIEQLTDDQHFGVWHYSTTANGETLVYQSGDEIYRQSTNTNKEMALPVDLKTDFRFDPVVTKNKTDNIEQYALSPNGKLTAYIIRGDVFVTRNDKKDSRSVRLTDGAARERNVTWVNDNTLLFSSDRYGQYDLFTLTSSDENNDNIFTSLKHTTHRLTSTEADELAPVVAPDKEQVAYLQGRGKLITGRLTSEGELTALTTLLDGWDTPKGVAWSPDSHWLAYSLADLSFNQEVYIQAADNTHAPVNVSMHPKYDTNPVWSPDGSKLGFVSARNNGDDDIWFVWLKKADWQRSKEEWRRQALMQDDSKPVSTLAAEKDNEGTEPVTVTIDFDGLYQRLQQVTALHSNENQLVFAPDGEHLYFTIGGAGRQNFKADKNLYKITWDGEDKTVVIGGNNNVADIALSENGKYLFALTKGGKLNRISAKDDKVEALSVKSTLKINYQDELTQLFDEGWRALNNGFYDPAFHGQDWQALREKYRPLALEASTKEDFKRVFNRMLGQINASHMGMYRGDNQKVTQKQKTGLLGIAGQPVQNGFAIISVVADSPADRIESRLQPKDVITEVNQQPVAGHNLYDLLQDTANTPVLLTIERNNQQQEITIWPTASLSDENYNAWVNERRRLTEAYSNGRLGYLHIRGMNWTSFERFERDLMAAGYGKEGLVIDVRYNGGGWTTDYLMEVLNVKQYAYTIPRGAIDDINGDRTAFKNDYPFSERLPVSVWNKPTIAMTNQNSYSNAEIFSHAYQALGLGKVVGRPTFGAVISTGAYLLVDGSTVRMPFRGWWVKDSGDNMEGSPAQPDIEVFNPPAYKAKGVDPQLKRAVEELMNDL